MRKFANVCCGVYLLAVFIVICLIGHAELLNIKSKPSAAAETKASELAGKQKRSEAAEDCNYAAFGCCPDGVTAAESSSMENCPPLASPDQKLSGEHSDDDDNDDDDKENDENGGQDHQDENDDDAKQERNSECSRSEFGCCSDNKTPAKGPYKEGCIDYSCKHSEFGCCTDQVTPAKSVDLKDCPISCYQSLYGCCPDGKQASRGLGYAGCNNNDGENKAAAVVVVNYAAANTNAHNLPPGVNNCVDTKYECCPDGITAASGPGFLGCKEETNYQAYKAMSDDYDVCIMPEPSRSCDNYTLQWRFDADDGRCVQFWYGGCNANANQFSNQNDCENKCVKPNGTDICKLPLVNPTKQCHENLTRYYYDVKSSSCKMFSYSGCLGNANNFETYEECERRCQVPLLFEQCSYIPDKGPCHGNNERWYFDSKIGRCKTFMYGGCLKNKNNHLSESDCIGSCVKPKQRPVCHLPKIVGNCEQSITSYYYDFIDAKCKRFTYLGCSGNLNRFESLESCEYTCQGLDATEKKATIRAEICEAPKVAGTCHLQLQRWYYNSTTMMCHQFTYSGCDGNSNNFETESDCRSICNAKEADPCVLPLDYGTCDKYKIYWYFNQVDKECVRFYYGGCDGNQNRFESREHCDIQCKLSKEEKEALLRLPKQCIMPMEYGNNCETLSPKWYFDTTTKQCYPFEYSGCGPAVSNRFENQNECQQTCVDTFFNRSSSSSSIDDNDRNSQSAAAEATTSAFSSSSQLETESEVVAVSRTTTEAAAAAGRISYDFCDHPMSPGNCSQKVMKWFYDKNTKYCRQFEFTGCNGNENKFETRQQCIEICEKHKRREICNSNKIQGPCTHYQRRWYLDTETRTCKEFKYGGCMGNENNFESKIECRNFCWEYLSDDEKQNEYQNQDSSSSSPTSTDDEVDEEYGGSSSSRNRHHHQQQQQQQSNQPDSAVFDVSLSSSTGTTLPCESAVEISRECLNEHMEILPYKTSDYLANKVWYYEIDSRSCKFISAECIKPSSTSTTTTVNRFNSYDACKSQCIPFVSENQTQGGQNKCPDLHDCQETCKHGRVKSLSGCELCECINPCEKLNCPSSELCVVENFLPKCRPKFKSGGCPLQASIEHKSCNSTCSSDAECPFEKKCCPNSCAALHCVSPSFDLLDPTIEDFVPPKIELFEGDTLTLPCRVSGVPTPKVSWFKNRNEFTSSNMEDGRIRISVNNTLTIENVTEKDAMVYSCRASNNAGKAVVKESTVSIIVPVRLSHGSYEKHEHYGMDAYLYCNATGRPIPKIKWRTEKFEIKSNPLKYITFGNVLIIKRFDSFDLGRYSCLASNGFGLPVTANVTLKRATPAEVLFSSYDVYGELSQPSVLLSCNHTGSPKPTVTWHTPKNQLLKFKNSTSALHDAKMIPASKYQVLENGDLIVNNLTISDIGLYQCSVSNQYSFGLSKKRQGTVLLDIYDPPKITSKQSRIILANQSDSLVLSCEVSGKPKPEIKWYKDQTLIASQSSNSSSTGRSRPVAEKYQLNASTGALTISSLNEDDNAVFRCEVKSSSIMVDHRSLSILSLNYTVKTATSSSKKAQNRSMVMSVNETESLEIDCLIEADDEIADIIWLFNETIQFTSSENNNNYPYKYDFTIDKRRLILYNVNVDQSGVYDCMARTGTRDYATRVHLSVLEKDLVKEFKHKIVRLSDTDESIVLDCTWWWLIDSFNNYLLNEKTHAQWSYDNDRKLLMSLDNNDDDEDSFRKYEFLDNHNTLLKINSLTADMNNTNFTCSFRLHKQSTLKISKFTLSISDKNSNSFSNAAAADETYHGLEKIKWADKFDRIELECPFSQESNKIKWFINETVINASTSSSSSSSSISNNRNVSSAIYEINVKNGSSRLVINELTSALEGIYTCNATTIDEKQHSTSYNVQIADPIYLIEPSRSVYFAKKYENIEITCQYTGGKPKPTVKWYRNGTKLVNYAMQPNVRPSKPNKSAAVASIVSLKSTRKDPFNIYNKANNNSSRSKFYKENNLKYIFDHNILIIKNVSKTDTGLYTCSLSNGYHLEQSLNFSLIVQEPMLITIEPEQPTFRPGDEAAKISCRPTETADESRVTQISWFRNGVKLVDGDKYALSETGAELTIRNLSGEDAGKYICRVYVGPTQTGKAVNVRVEDDQVVIDCEDTSSHADCKLVVSKGLCSKWGKYCCRTCTLAGHMKKKRLN